MGESPFNSIGSNGQKKNISTQITSEVEFFWLNLSKKVKCHLFCINLETGYLLYVVLWIPKAFSLLTHHPRVVFTISTKKLLDGHYNLQFFTLFCYYVIFEPETWKTGSVLNRFSSEPVFQVSGSKMTCPEQMTISSKRVTLIIFVLKVMINLWVGWRRVRINIEFFYFKVNSDFT